MAKHYGSSDSMIGGKLAPRIALLVKHVMDQHLRESGHHRAKIGAQAGIEFFRTITDERDSHMADFIAKALQGSELTPEVRQLLHFIHKGKGELSALLTHSLVSSAVGTSIGSGLANILAPANQAIMYADPAQVLEPTAMAQLAAARIVSESYAAEISRMSGFPEEATNDLIEAARSYPPLGSLLELLRRGQISGEEVVLALRRAGIPEQYIGPMMTLKDNVLDPEQLALMVLKGIKTPAEGAAEASHSGVDASRFESIILATGEPPGLEQMMEAYRRKLIDGSRFEKAVRQSRVRDEWTDVLLALRFQPASPADAIRGAVQGHLSPEQAKVIAEDGSLRGEDFGWMLETAGNPPGPMTMIELWRRGDATQAQVEQAIREGRTKNKYIPNLINLKRVLPPQRTVVTMLSHGAITEADAARLLHEHGYDDTTVKGYILAATSGQSLREKNLARGEITELYYDHAIDNATALRYLKVLGYTDTTAKIVLAMADLKRERAIQQAAMSPIRSAYIGRHIDAAEARTRLDGVGVPAQQRDFALRLWAVDREAHTKQLTEAQIVKANTQGLIDDAQAEDRLLTLGYNHGDARLLLDMEKGRTTPAP